jgi:hypothetical protein
MNDNFPIVTDVEGLVETLERLIASDHVGVSGGVPAHQRRAPRSARAVRAWRAESKRER